MKKFSTFFMMISNEYGNIATALTWTTLIHSLLACLASYTILAIILYNLFCNHIKREDRVVVVLCAKIYTFLSISSTILLSLNIQTILGDFNGQSFNSSWCIFWGYFSFTMLYMMYMSFVNQVSEYKRIFYLILFLGIVSVNSNCLLSIRIFAIIEILHDIITSRIDVFMCFIMSTSSLEECSIFRE